MLFDPDSHYGGIIADCVLSCRRSPEGEETRQSRADSQTLEVLKVQDAALRIYRDPWDGDNPNDHGQVFEVLRERLTPMGIGFADRELIIHVSPGMLSMQGSPMSYTHLTWIRPFAKVQNILKIQSARS